jgi:hypothetical protein
MLGGKAGKNHMKTKLDGKTKLKYILKIHNEIWS